MITLKILNDIRDDQRSAEAMLLNFKILLRVLDYSKVKLTYNEHRMIMELLCSLTYKTDFSANRNNLEKRKLEEERSALQEQLEMMTNKQICNPDTRIKQFGIIGSVKIVRSLVDNVVLGSEVDASEDVKMDDIPPGPIRDAAKCVDFIFNSVRGDPHNFAMVCDELYIEFQAKGEGFSINEMFLVWLIETLFKRFEALVIAGLAIELPDEFSNQFEVKSEEISEADHAIRLATLVIQEKNEEVVMIPSLFKVTRLLFQHRFKGFLPDILHVYAVMPITLTKDFGDSRDEMENVEVSLMKFPKFSILSHKFFSS